MALGMSLTTRNRCVLKTGHRAPAKTMRKTRNRKHTCLGNPTSGQKVKLTRKRLPEVTHLLLNPPNQMDLQRNPWAANRPSPSPQNRNWFPRAVQLPSRTSLERIFRNFLYLKVRDLRRG